MSSLIPFTVKAGYPPRPLTLFPELPFSSLGVAKGDQIIVSEVSGSESFGEPVQSPSNTATTSPPRSSDFTRSSETTPLAPGLLPGNSTGPDFVDTADGSVLVHRVRVHYLILFCV